MNKYQEALDRIKYFDDIRLKDLWAPDNNIKYQLSLIQELVDKTSPKKPNTRESQFGIEYYCSICNEFLGRSRNVKMLKEVIRKNKGCSHCLNAIDWSEDEAVKKMEELNNENTL